MMCHSMRWVSNEFSALSSPNFEFPASENSAMSAENSDTKTDSSCPLAGNSAMSAENSDTKTYSSCPLAGNSAMSAENSDIKTDSRWVNIEFPASSSASFRIVLCMFYLDGLYGDSRPKTGTPSSFIPLKIFVF